MVPPVSRDELRQPVELQSATPDPNASLIHDVPLCMPQDTLRARFWLNPTGTQAITTSMLEPNDLAQLPQADRDRMRNIVPTAWQQIVGRRGDFLYYAALQSGSYITLFQPVCRTPTPEPAATCQIPGAAPADPNCFALYYADMPRLQHPPSSAAVQAVPMPGGFSLGEIDAILGGVTIAGGQYGVEIGPNGRFTFSIAPDAVLLSSIRTFINRPDSRIAQSRRANMTAAFQVDNYGNLAFQRRTEENANRMRDEMRWTMIAMAGLQVLTTAFALGKGAKIVDAVTLFPRMLLTPPFEAVVNLGRLVARRPVDWSYTRRAYGDAYRMLTPAGRHRATLDRMTIDATENARRFQTDFQREYNRALEEIRRSHPGLSQQDLADRARGAARNSLRGSFSDYVAAEEMLHSIELGLRSSNPEERADAQARLDRIIEAENVLVRDKNANPVFVDVKGTGKSIRMYAIVLRSIRGQSSVPPDAIQRRNWRELSRRGLMGTGEGDSAKYVGNLETSVQNLVDAIKYLHDHGQSTTLIIDEIHSFFGNKEVDPHFMKALQIIKGPMAMSNFIAALGSTTPEEWAEVTSDQAMADRLKAIRFPETNPATMRLAVVSRLLTVSPDSLSQPGVADAITRLIESSQQLEGRYSPRQVLDGALPAILSNGNLTVDGVNRYFHGEREMRINEVIKTVVATFEPIALQARLMEGLQPGSSGGAIPDAELRQRVVQAVMQTGNEKGWSALINAEGSRIVTEAFARTRVILGAPPPNPNPQPPPPPRGPAPAPRPPAPVQPDPPQAQVQPGTNPLNRFRADALRDGDFYQALTAIDPDGRLARAYRTISPEARPLRNVGQFMDAVAVHYPELMSTVVSDLARRGITVETSPWRVLYETTARLASAEADGRLPRVRVADVQARLPLGADFESRMGGRAAEDPTRRGGGGRSVEEREREARDPVRRGRP